ncbi:hypothetical protein Salat_0184600 [Sesamum alatum]|uniref:RNase H type-1 domain-containing protein n=1 Tax=Sesamum alatum TaxID=300844 RepID=A0AAE1YYX1_9LAMI|nr:hypothetical protein Salat_0184600 [Sesamum alatum]
MALVSASMEAKESNRFLCICWTLWWCKNIKIMSSKCINPEEVISFVERYLNAFLAQNADTAISPAQQGATSWEGPLVGSIKLNFDGTLLDGGSTMRIGVVARNEKGECLVLRTKRVNKRGNGEFAEALAAWEAIQLAACHGWTSVIIEGDCAVLVNKLRVVNRGLSPVGTIILDILRLVDCFAPCQFTCVKRNLNSVAHCLA